MHWIAHEKIHSIQKNQEPFDSFTEHENAEGRLRLEPPLGLSQARSSSITRCHRPVAGRSLDVAAP
jgi:hypothetical protein